MPPRPLYFFSAAMTLEQKHRLEEIKAETSAASYQLQINGDSYAAVARLIDAVLMLTTFLETL